MNAIQYDRFEKRKQFESELHRKKKNIRRFVRRIQNELAERDHQARDGPQVTSCELIKVINSFSLSLPVPPQAMNSAASIYQQCPKYHYVRGGCYQQVKIQRITRPYLVRKYTH